jgi:chromosome segregation ATPase
LKARIARLEDSSVRDVPLSSPTAKPLRTLVAELEEAEQYNATRRSEIDLILNSDLAANITEKEQEAVILYEELQRCQQLRRETEAVLGDLNREFERLRHKFSREVLKRNEELIQSLEERVEGRGRLAEQAADALRQRRESAGTARARLAQRIAALQAQIRADEEEVAALDAQIAAKAVEVERLQGRCEQVP